MAMHRTRSRFVSTRRHALRWPLHIFLVAIAYDSWHWTSNVVFMQAFAPCRHMRSAVPAHRSPHGRVAARFFQEVVESLGKGTLEKQLTVASQIGDEAEVRRLLDEGADPNVAGGGGVTPLIMASINGHETIVEMLLDRHADPNAAMSDGQGGATPLLVAAQQGHDFIVRLLAEQGANVNKARNDGATPVFAAAKNGHTMVVRSLLSYGADPNLATEMEDTPLDVALANGHEPVADALRKIGTHKDLLDA
mmetsp:Transcript_21176/g.59258  ORF Transcript_21176/g.59258 Transcript_21176/m.59258 type:complete len:250 (-) Transcript_21176:38-787(-)